MAEYRDYVRSALEFPLWTCGVQIWKAVSNRFVTCFEMVVLHDDVLHSGPQRFDNAMDVVLEYDGMSDPGLVEFFFIEGWRRL